MAVATLRSEFADANLWTELAKERKIRLPLWRMACTTGGMRRFLKKLDVSVDEYLEVNNERNLRHFAAMNPDWPLRAWVGLLLEWLEWRDKKPQPKLPFKPQARKAETVGDLIGDSN